MEYEVTLDELGRKKADKEEVYICIYQTFTVNLINEL